MQQMYTTDIIPDMRVLKEDYLLHGIVEYC